MSDLKLPSPISQLPGFHSNNIELFLKREDLIHPSYGGNKWRKLKYNLEAFKEGGFSEIATFGGPFSNHIAATAAVCQAKGIASVGIIRGTYTDEHNPTLLTASANGMKLIHVTKEAYKNKEQSDEIKMILEAYRQPYLIPEGGSNALALRGVGELIEELSSESPSYDHIVVAAGTGTTAAGIISRAKEAKVTVINVLKNASLKATIAGLLPENCTSWEVKEDYNFGGFARANDELILFINKFYTAYGIALDPVYNGKAMYATMDLVKKNYFLKGSRILYIHTGGNQGITAYNYCTKETDVKILV